MSVISYNPLVEVELLDHKNRVFHRYSAPAVPRAGEFVSIQNWSAEVWKVEWSDTRTKETNGNYLETQIAQVYLSTQNIDLPMFQL